MAVMKYGTVYWVRTSTPMSNLVAGCCVTVDPFSMKIGKVLGCETQQRVRRLDQCCSEWRPQGLSPGGLHISPPGKQGYGESYVPGLNSKP